jgi:ParB-like chromosome segregation protein Spo0J
MKISIKNIAELKQDPKNVRKHSERNLEKVRNSLKKFGQQKPIVINSDGIVIAGNGTYAAAKELGWEKINCVETNLNGDEAVAYAIADNRTAELSEWDNIELHSTLEALSDDLKDFTGFSDIEIQTLVVDPNRIADDPEKEWEGMPEYAHEDKRSFQKLIVHFRNQEDVDEFSKMVNQKIGAKTKFIWHPIQEDESFSDIEYVST